MQTPCWTVVLLHVINLVAASDSDTRRNITLLVVAAKNISWSDHELSARYTAHEINLRRDLFPNWRISIHSELTNGVRIAIVSIINVSKLD